jgi:dCTP deaminase
MFLRALAELTTPPERPPGGVVLSDYDLRKAIALGELDIDPLDAGNIQPASIDLRLSDEFSELPPEHTVFPGYTDPLAPPLEQPRHRTVEQGGQYPLSPGGFALASTVEVVTLSASLAGVVAGKSSLARVGLIVESAGFVDPGWSGQLTLELANLTDRTIMLTPGMLIAQLVVHRLDSPSQHPYGSTHAGSHYQGQRGPTPSRAYERGRRDKRRASATHDR